MPYCPQQFVYSTFKKTSKNFDARLQCDRRRYEYLLPVFVLEDGVVRKPDISLPGLPDTLAKVAEGSLSVDEAAEAIRTEAREEALQGVGGSTMTPVEMLHEVMQQYVGTHNFHNFTAGLQSNSAQAVRFMIEISAEEIVVGGEKFARIRLYGQSFLLHQIRKMIYAATEIVRGTAPSSAIADCLRGGKQYLHLVPGEGLFLDQVEYDAYNSHKVAAPHTYPLELSAEAQEQVEAFKAAVIYPTIASSLESGVFQEYLRVVQQFPWGTYDHEDK
mmetsp:Transcript_78447/g.179499  ORF Transcript_78447/g.179499 Transcript_78447/m.179499 type:complete len:274 (+) Transcript_78447:234-1055(+)